MGYSKIVFTAAGVGLLTMISFAAAQADRLTAAQPETSGLQSNSPSSMTRKIVSIEPPGEIPLGLLIKTPETPHGVSFNQQVAHFETAPLLAHS